MNLRRAVAALAGTACTTLMAGALMAGPAAAAPAGQVGGAPSAHSAASAKIAPRDGATRTVLTLSPFVATFGQETSEVLTVSVGAINQGGVPPHGLVRVLEGTTEVCEFTFNSFGGHCSPGGDSQLAPGPHSLTAVYNGDGNNFPSASMPQLLTVAKGQATVSLSVPTTTVTFGAEGAMHPIVTVTPSAEVIPTGSVSLMEDGIALCTIGLPDRSNTTECPVSDVALQPGSHQLTASYQGDSNLDPAQSAAQAVMVERDPTSTTLTLSASSVSVSQEDSLQISGRITPAVPVPGVNPTGHLQFAIIGNIICQPEVSGTTGSCALAAGQLPPGTYQLDASYSGDGNFASSIGETQTLTITADPPAAVATSTTLALSAAKATFGHEQAERLSVQVNAQSGIPAGKVTVKTGSTGLCTITLVQGKGNCALAATKLRPGKFQLTASYAGGTGFQASASGAKALTVAAEPTATTLKLSAAKVKSGHERAEHLSVQVKPQFSGTPAGKVTIKSGTVKVCVITLKNGKGSCALKPSQLRDRRWLVLAVIGIAQLMVVLDSTIVNIALPSAQEQLGFSNSDRQWVVTAYALAFGSLLLVGGRLGDMYSRKWVFVAGLAGFAIASAIGGAAGSFAVLVAARRCRERSPPSSRRPHWAPSSARSTTRASAAGPSASSAPSPPPAAPSG